MRLLAADDTCIRFQGRRRVRAPLLVGFAFVIVAVAPLIVAPSLDPLRLSTSAIAAALAAAFIRAGYPVREFVQIRPAENLVVTHHGTYALGDALGVELTSRQEEDDTPMYRAELVLKSHARVVLLQGSKPGRVLRELGTLLERQPLPVETGWGLPQGVSPWRHVSQEPAPVVQGDATANSSRELLSVAPFSSRREIGLTVIGFGLGAASLMAFEMTERLQRGDELRPLSLFLPIVSSAVVLLIGAGVLTYHLKIFGNDLLVIEERCFGVSLRKRSLRKGSIRGVYPIGTTQIPHHVLLDTETGPLTLRCGDRHPSEVAAAIARWL